MNPQINVPGLTVNQLKDIYTGKIRNWQQVGGPNLAIIPYSRSAEDSGTVKFFVNSVLAGQPLSAKVIKLVNSTTVGLGKIATNPGGIYYASAPEVVPQCSVRPLPLGLQAGNFISPYQKPFIALQSCHSQRNKVNLKAFEKGFGDGQYPLTRYVSIIVKDFDGGNDIEEQAGKAYANLLLTDEGQRLIEKVGFVPIRSTNKACPTR